MFVIFGIVVVALFINEIRKESKRAEESNRFIASCFIKELEKNENQA